MKNQEFGLPVLANPAKVQEMKNKYNDFKSWAMVGEGRNMSGCFISTTKLREMLEANEEPDGFKICFGIVDDSDGNKASTYRSLEIIMTAVNFSEGQGDEGYIHEELGIYTSLPPIGIEPPVLKCPPLDCTITIVEPEPVGQ